MVAAPDALRPIFAVPLAVSAGIEDEPDDGTDRVADPEAVRGERTAAPDALSKAC